MPVWNNYCCGGCFGAKSPFASTALTLSMSETVQRVREAAATRDNVSPVIGYKRNCFSCGRGLLRRGLEGRFGRGAKDNTACEANARRSGRRRLKSCSVLKECTPDVVL